MKKDSTIKVVGLAVLAIVVLWFLKAILFPTGYGVTVSYGMQGHMGNGNLVYSYGVNNFGGSIAVLLAFIIKVLLIVFTVALFVGLVMLVIKNVFTQENIASIKNTFTTNSEEANKVCTECSKKLDEDWKICPHCGKEVEEI